MLISSVAGPYTATYQSRYSGVLQGAATSLGIAERGWELSAQKMGQPVTGTDAYADTVIEGVHRGVNVFLSTNLIEWSQSVLNAATPWQVTHLPDTGVGGFQIGQVGQLDTSMAGILVLNAVASTSASAKPASVTALYAILSQGHNLSWVFGPEQRKIPVRFSLLPWDAGFTTPVAFTVT